MIYVKPDVRPGLLGRMLRELLETRVMVKQAMKGVGNDKVLNTILSAGCSLSIPLMQALRRILDARQLSLKFIANVTYGYTSASYSGRMPAVEIADSIVQSGRETLEKAKSLCHLCGKPILIHISGCSHYRFHQKVGGEGGIRRYRLPICISSWQDEGTSFYHWTRYCRDNHNNEPGSCQVEVREGRWIH